MSTYNFLGRKEVERKLHHNNTQTETNREGKNNFTPPDTHSEILLRLYITFIEGTQFLYGLYQQPQKKN
jgi:hypothetical protein